MKQKVKRVVMVKRTNALTDRRTGGWIKRGRKRWIKESSIF